MLAKKTFCNLPHEKQRKIIEVAIQEFATRGYQKASINTMIASLGIAKGSMYQYFENKESLFRYIFEYGVRLLKDNVHQTESIASPGQDTFTKIQTFFSSAIVFVKKYPLIFRLYLRTVFESDLPFKQELVSRIHLFSMAYLVPLLEEGKARGDIRSDCKPQLAAFMIMAIIDRFLQSYLWAYLDSASDSGSPSSSPSSSPWLRPENLEQDLMELMKILERGLKARPGEEREIERLRTPDAVDNPEGCGMHPGNSPEN
ncbi:MAG: TetR/AcrR family transcriptional regulator [bacterium]